MQTLRKYQTEAVEAVMEAIDPFRGGYSRVLYTCAVGTGKTTILAELINRLLTHGDTVLVLAHRVELIEQGYSRIKSHCALHEHEIGTEIAEWKANPSNRVIVGSVQTCMNAKRLPEGWKPTVIIVDEGHHASANSYKKIATRFGVYDGRCVQIGLTATAKRTDRHSLYAIDLDGNPVLLERKGHPPRPASVADSVFERHVFDYPISQAIEEGYLVDIVGHTKETSTSLDGIKVVGGEFVDGELAKRVDNAERTMEAISAWKKVADGRQSIVFCAGVEHAHHAAELWREAGYNAMAIDGETDKYERHKAVDAFKAGELQVICNDSVFTEGTDLPNCSCIVHLKPTRSWGRYVQSTGRGMRPWDGVLNGLEEADADERKAAIAASRKKDCAVLDMVDLYEKCGDLCTIPAILDLPVKLDLQGHSLMEAKKLLDEFEEVKKRVIGSCPATFHELKVRLRRINLMRTSGAKTEKGWKSADDGYVFTKTPPGYTCEMKIDGESYRLLVKSRSQVLIDKTGKPDRPMKDYLDAAAARAETAITEDRASKRKTSEILTPKQVNCLKANGHRLEEIDKMTSGYAKALIARYMQAWAARRGVRA